MKKTGLNLLWVTLLWMVVGSQAAQAAVASSSTAQSTKKPLEKVVLQLKWLHQFQFAGYYAAQKEGYFRDEGLKVEIRQRDLRKNNVEQVINGEAQYGIADSVLFLYLAKKRPVVIVAPIFQNSPQVLFTLKSSGLDSPYKLQGKKIAFYLNDTDGFPVLAMMKQLNVEPIYDRMLIKTDPNILARKEVDAYSGYLTNEAYFLRQGGNSINIINPLNYGIDLYGDMLFTSRSEATEHPDRVLRFKKAVLKGWKYAMAHKAEMARYILETYHPPHKTFAHLMYEANALDNIIAQNSVPIGTLDEGRVRFINHLLKQHGLINNNIDLKKGIYRENTCELQFTPSELAWMKKHPVVRLAIDNNWAPIEYVGENGNYQGIGAAFFNYIAMKTGLNFMPDKRSSWVQAVEKMKNGQLDVYSAAISTADRRKYVNFTEPYVRFPTVIATRDNAPYMSDVKLLAGKLVAVTDGYAMQEEMRRLYPNVKLLPVKNASEGLKDVSLGKVYGYIDNVASIGHYIKSQGLANVKISGELPFKANIAIGVRKDWPELQGIIQKVLNHMPAETYASLINPWLKVKYETKYQWKELLIYLVPIFVIFIIVLWYNLKLRQAKQQLKETNTQLSMLLVTDHLTKVYNRQYLDQTLDAEKIRVDRYSSKLSVIMVDLDHFKKINDEYGHMVGDKVLVDVSNVIRLAIRKTDVFGRWGGEEFMIVCPETGLQQTLRLAEKIRRTVEKAVLVHGIQQTLSLGVAEYRLTEKISDTVKRADECLYEAKRAGRNQVKCD
ncbi:diguanylate cyclase [Hydrogenovibrio sp. JE_KL2]|uniref:transporter substrate-binding domain-containing diguanylate cyclase n=1 Tax=Hydrogenovibrio sp. JE_KL2 TaxID=2651188 RepID=UPI001561DF85